MQAFAAKTILSRFRTFYHSHFKRVIERRLNRSSLSRKFFFVRVDFSIFFLVWSGFFNGLTDLFYCFQSLVSL